MNTNTINVSDGRNFHIDDIGTGRFWFTLGGIGITAGGHFTKDEIRSLRDMLSAALGER